MFGVMVLHQQQLADALPEFILLPLLMRMAAAQTALTQFCNLHLWMFHVSALMLPVTVQEMVL
jgi:hypothetical protein